MSILNTHNLSLYSFICVETSQGYLLIILIFTRTAGILVKVYQGVSCLNLLNADNLWGGFYLGNMLPCLFNDGLVLVIKFQADLVIVYVASALTAATCIC